MTAGREAAHGDMVRIDLPFIRVAAHKPDGSGNIVKRAGIGRTLAERIAQNERIIALLHKRQRNRLALAVGQICVSATGADDDGGAPCRFPFLVQIPQHLGADVAVTGQADASIVR